MEGKGFWDPIPEKGFPDTLPLCTVQKTNPRVAGRGGVALFLLVYGHLPTRERRDRGHQD